MNFQIERNATFHHVKFAIGFTFVFVGAGFCMWPTMYCSTIEIRRDKSQMEDERKAEYDDLAGTHSYGGFWLYTFPERVRSKVALYPVIDQFNLTDQWKYRRPVRFSERRFVIGPLRRIKERLSGKALTKGEAYRLLLDRIDATFDPRYAHLMSLTVRSFSQTESIALARAIGSSAKKVLQDRTLRLLPNEQPKIDMEFLGCSSSPSIAIRGFGVLGLIAGTGLIITAKVGRRPGGIE